MHKRGMYSAARSERRVLARPDHLCRDPSILVVLAVRQDSVAIRALFWRSLTEHSSAEHGPVAETLDHVISS